MGEQISVRYNNLVLVIKRLFGKRHVGVLPKTFFLYSKFPQRKPQRVATGISVLRHDSLMISSIDSFSLKKRSLRDGNLTNGHVAHIPL